MLKNLRLAFILLWREWRAGEWFVVCIALLLAITATTAIHFYTDRLTRGLQAQSAKFLGGDLAISSPTPIPLAWKQKAGELHLRTSEVLAYPSVVTAGNQLQLVNVQAVADNYPLLGGLADNRPALHTVWVEPRLLPLLGVKLQDEVTIGVAKFQISKLLTSDVDSLNTGWAIAPRLMMLAADVPATNTMVAGSRIDYRLLIVGDKEALQQWRVWIIPHLNASQHLLDATTQQLAIQNILQRAEDYMQLILLACLLMSGVAIALSIQQYMRRHYSHIALWRCLGATQPQITAILLWQLATIALLTGIFGVAIGFAAQAVFAHLFQQFLQFPLPKAGVMPLLLGLTTSILLLFAFAGPVIDELPRTSPLYIWRNELTARVARRSVYLLAAFALISVFVFWVMKFSLLCLYFIGALLLSVGVLYGLSILLLNLVRRLTQTTNGVVRRGFSQLIQYADSVSLQFISFNLILIALIVLAAIRTHLIEHWQQSLPAETPNYFAFNIAPADLPGLQQFFQQQNVNVAGIYPMVRGRLITLNGQPILSSVPIEAINNNALHRELNLSWMLDYPADNKIVAGRAITQADAGKALVSVEKKLADDLHLHLGDQLTFQIGERTLAATIVNFRTLAWTSFHPNFFMIFPPGLMQDYPVTYITSFHLQAAQVLLLNQLVASFPNITVIDVASLLQQMQALIGKITLAMEYLFVFALGAGILIFITSVQASMDERRKTYSLLRVLGAGNKYIYQSVTVEFGSLAILIIGAALSLSYLIVWLLEHSVFTA
jgi:putative ABC transport system permease protein